ncbi:MAG: bifunctional molybdenum cofactor biosynthesis protein MoaC/MoaB [Rhodoglobus sp.]
MGTVNAGLSHLDADGRARMVDVGDKAITRRTAVATGTFTTTPGVIALVKAENLPKADVLATARVAGIQGAKRTSELIPLCHPLPLSSVNVDFEFGDDRIVITATARTTGQTGVEMEALTAVAIAGLTLHDMTKAVDPHSVLGDIRVTSKAGGKTRASVRPGTAAVLVASTSAAAGTREDTTGPVIAAWLDERGYAVDAVTVAADADVAEALAAALAESPALVITTGGTGMTPTDRTPEATRPLLTRELPGIAEAIRARGLRTTATAALSRGLAGTAGDTIVVNLPGSPGGVRDGLAVLDELLEHLVAQLGGDGRH